jgi:hypothetical protein
MGHGEAVQLTGICDSSLTGSLAAVVGYSTAVCAGPRAGVPSRGWSRLSRLSRYLDCCERLRANSSTALIELVPSVAFTFLLGPRPSYKVATFVQVQFGAES